MSHSSHPGEDAELLSPLEFIEEFWPILMFGSFFLMMAFLPLLALPNHWIFFAAVIGTFVLFLALFTPVALHACCKK